MPGPVANPAAHARRRVTVDLTPPLRRLVMTDAPMDGDAIAAVWHRYLAERSPADERRLFDHYAPVVWMWTRRTVGDAGTELFPDPLADYLSDATLGLLMYIRRSTTFTPGRMFVRAGLAVRKAVWVEARRRSWAGKSGTEKRRTVERVRERLADRLGRAATRR